MIEIPEAVVLSRQIADACGGHTIEAVEVGHLPHKFAWFYGEPGAYAELLSGTTVGASSSIGGFVQLEAGEARVLFSEGMIVRFHAAGSDPPAKHQLRLVFSDGTSLTASAQMYGGVGAVPATSDGSAALDNEYYQGSLNKPSPLDDGFTPAYFTTLLESVSDRHMSAKAFLATEQRVPGLGNGVLQDILYEAGLHPRYPVESIASAEDPRARRLYRSVRTVLSDMASSGGRDTERDLYGEPGGYHTRLSRFTVGTPCARCGSAIQKQSYLGGTVYFCPRCQASE
jgi:formamidopyrimidine-DNA glycosylase